VIPRKGGGIRIRNLGHHRSPGEEEEEEEHEDEGRTSDSCERDFIL
jgi:hypothetical protein